MKSYFYLLFLLSPLLIAEPAAATNLASGSAGAIAGPENVTWVVLMALFGLIGVYPRLRRAQPMRPS